MRKKWGHRWFATTSMMVMFLLLSTLSVKADPRGHMTQELQRSLKQTGARWTAGDNEISRLSQEDFQRLLGLDTSAPAFRAPGDPVIDENSYNRALPAKFDWRNYKGKNYVTSVKRQRCGDCWAHSAAGTLESRLMIDGEAALDLSEQLLVSSCCSAGSCGGGTIVGASRFLVDVGIPEENCYPYRGSDSSCGNACSGWKNIAYRATSYSSVRQTVEAMKTALYTRGPVNVGYMVYSDFSRYKSGIYELSPGSRREGGHGVIIVGYDDNQQCFIVKNSWGTGWGENGYFRIAYSQVNNAVDFGTSAAVLGDDIDHTDEDDHDPPTPDPMRWKSQPAATGSKTITMTAETASDPSGVAYFFECVAGNCHDSGWQDNPTYTDAGLMPETTYSYRVKARDGSGQENETDWSAVAQATTLDAKAAIEIISPFRSGLSHPAPQGGNRLMALSIHAEDDNAAVRVTRVTYGGQPMTLAVEEKAASSGYQAYAAIFVLGEGGLAKAGGSNFNVTWSETPSRTPGYTSAVFSNVNSIEPVSSTDGASGTGNRLSTAALTTEVGDMALVAATCGNPGTYDVIGDFSKALEHDIPSSDAVVGYLPADGQPATAGVFHSDTNRQAVVGLVLSLAGDTPPLQPPSNFVVKTGTVRHSSVKLPIPPAQAE